MMKLLSRPIGLALAITLLGCIAPFFGTIEFLLQSHRRKLAEAEAVTS